MPNFNLFRRNNSKDLPTYTRKSSTSSDGGRRKSSGNHTAIHKGIIKVFVIGDKGIGKTTMCRLYTEQDEKDNEALYCKRGVTGERKFSTAKILRPSEHAKITDFSHYELEITVASTQWCKKNIRAYRDLVISSNCFLLLYRKSKRESFMSLVELISDIKRFRQGHVAMSVASINNEEEELSTNDVRNEDLLILQQERHEVTINNLNEIESLFKNLIIQFIAATF